MRVGRRRRRVFRRGLACGNRHRRAGVRRAGGARHAGLDIERVEAAGFFQRLKAGIAHPRRGRRGWHRAAGRAGRSECRPAADRAASCRAGFRRARAARQAPATPAGRRPFAVFRRVRRCDHGFGRIGCFRRRRRAVGFALSSRADNCRASSSKALFSTGVSTGDFDSPIGPKRQDVFGRFHGRFQIGWW